MNRKEMHTMKEEELMKLHKEQARAMRKSGYGYGTIGMVTGLKRHTVRYICRDIKVAGEGRQKVTEGETCLYCGADLPKQKGAGRPHRFCSDSCRRNYWKIHREEGQKKPEAIYINSCVFCGKTFEVYGKSKQRFCSRHCHMMYRNGHRMTVGVAL